MQAQLQRQREEEFQRQQVYKEQQFDQQQRLRSKFEQRTDTYAQQNEIRRQLETLQLEKATQLELRRQKLRLIIEEEYQLAHEIIKRQEPTREDRINALKRRDAEYKKHKEEQRLKLVEEKMKQKFRNDCDELRQKESQVFARQVAEERQQQLIEKEQKRLIEEEEQKYYEKMMQEEMQKKLQRELAEAKSKEERQKATIKVLDEQLALLRAKAEESVKLKEQEAVLMKQKVADVIREDAIKQREKYKEHERRRRELDKFNAKRIKEKAHAVQDELKADLEFLSRLAVEEELNRKAKIEQEQKYRQEFFAYRDYLREQQLLEKQREKELDRLIYEDMERAAKEQDAKWEKEQEKRRKLMDEVMKSREELRRFKLEMNQKQQETLRKEQKEIEKFLDQEAKKDKLKREEETKRMEQYRVELAHQILDVRERRLAEEERIERELKAIQAEQAKYSDMVSKELDNVGSVRKFYGLQKSIATMK